MKSRPRSSRSRFFMRRTSDPNTTLPSTVLHGKSAYFCQTIVVIGPHAFRSPRNSTCPALDASRPAMICSRVDFPHPDGPRSVRNSFACTSRLVSRKAKTSLPRAAKRLSIPLTLISIGALAQACLLRPWLAVLIQGTLDLLDVLAHQGAGTAFVALDDGG